MRSRRYTKRVQFWQTSNVSDGFGGLTTSDALVATSWAEVKTMQNNNTSTSDGTINPFQSIRITLRPRNDIEYNANNMYIIYRGDRYIIQDAPVNVDYRDAEIMIIATRDDSIA